jgi:acetyl esterase/lipase
LYAIIGVQKCLSMSSSRAGLKELVYGRGARFLIRLFAASLVVAAFFVATQDLQIFPGIVSGAFRSAPLAPKWVREEMVQTADGETLPVWRVQGKAPQRKQVALILHGNADSLSTITPVQRWLASSGFTSYAIEYRGYAGSTGFPSENGIYLDGEAGIELLFRNEKLTAADVIVFGQSIGTGPAAYLAQKYSVGTLVLVAPYTSLTNVVRELPVFGYLYPFLRYNFPTQEFVGRLKDTCVVAAHGRLDSTIAYYHSEELKRAYRGNKTYILISAASAGHNDILGAVIEEISEALVGCVE